MAITKFKVNYINLNSLERCHTLDSKKKIWQKQIPSGSQQKRAKKKQKGIDAQINHLIAIHRAAEQSKAMYHKDINAPSMSSLNEYANNKMINLN